MDHATPTGAVGDPPTEVILYTRPGCGLCDGDPRRLLDALLARRAPTAGPAASSASSTSRLTRTSSAAFFAEIPVVEVAGRRLTLATSPGRIERLLAEVLDG